MLLLMTTFQLSLNKQTIRYYLTGDVESAN